MRKIIVLLLCLAMPVELYWLYTLSARPKVQEQTPIPKGNPVERLLGSPEAAKAIEYNQRRLPSGAGVVRGLLRDIDGEPAAGIVIAATSIVAFGEKPPADQPQWTATTDATGAFHLDRMPLGKYVLSAVEDKKHWVDAIELNKEFPLIQLRPQLKASLSLRGRIVDAYGKDVAEARVYPIPELGEADDRLSEDKLHQLRSYTLLPAVTDSGGEFALGHLPDRPWRLLLTAEGFANTLSDAITPPDATLALVMDTGARLEVELHLPEGQSPAANLNVELIEQQYGFEKYKAATDDTGKFSFGNLRPATWRLVALDSTHILPEPLRQIVISKDEPTKTLGGNLEVGGVISGHVLKRIHTIGLPGILVEAHSQDGLNTYQATTDKEGQYRFSGVIPGSYTLTPQLPDEYVLEEGTEQTIQVPAQQEITGPEFFAVKGLSIRGVVLDRLNEPVTNAVAHLEILGDPPLQREAKCNKDGRFVFPGINTDTVVRLSASGGGMLSEIYGPHNIERSGLDNIKLILSQPNRGGIMGTVVNPQGRLVADALVLCQPDENLKFDAISSHTDKFGGFQFNNLVPGTYTLTVGRSPEAIASNSAQSVTLEPNATLKDVQLLLP